MENLADLGRIIFGSFFVFMGLTHFLKLKAMTEYAAAKKVPQPKTAVLAGGLLLLFGGFSVIFNASLEWGVLALALFLTATSYKMHNFWAIEDAGEKTAQMSHFLKNTALIGAALTLLI